MTYQGGFGESWQGLLADGTLDMEKVARAYVEHYGYEMKSPLTAIVDMITIRRRQQRAKISCEQHPACQAGLRVCRPSFDVLRQWPTCENYVLSANSKEVTPPPAAVAAHTRPVVAELADAEPGRFAILALSNCRDLEDCTKQVLGHFGFTPRPEEAYKHYGEFSEAARELVENSISYFEAPCVKLLEHLEHQGFVGDVETY